MAYFEDLTPYRYIESGMAPETYNVGWLDQARAFSTCEPQKEDIDALWGFCQISVATTRGIHECNLCKQGFSSIQKYLSKSILLGSSEIRVISGQGRIYAASNLIFHYVSEHNYSPPAEFVAALRTGLNPESNEYLAQLRAMGVDWRETPVVENSGPLFRLGDLPP